MSQQNASYLYRTSGIIQVQYKGIVDSYRGIIIVNIKTIWPRLLNYGIMRSVTMNNLQN